MCGPRPAVALRASVSGFRGLERLKGLECLKGLEGLGLGVYRFRV